MPLTRDRCARISHQLGITSLLGTLKQRPSLVVLNYHRIGEPTHTLYDRALISATAEGFENQLRFLISRFEVVSLEQCIAIASGTMRPARTTVLITFDDGYRDNYEVAYPILRSYGASAVFFLATSFVGTNRLSWWDQIAHVIRGTNAEVLRLTYPQPLEFDLQTEDRGLIIERILRIYKSPAVLDPDRFIKQLEDSCGTLPQTAASRMFLDWTEAAEMATNGMFIGSHTHTHRLLAKLSRTEQREELALSKQVLEDKLRIPCRSLAYPVGKRTAFSPITESLVQDTGYDAAFSFYGGINLPGKGSISDIKRVAIESHTTQERFQLQLNLAAVTGSYWF